MWCSKEERSTWTRQKVVGSLQLLLKREGTKIEVKNDDQIKIERPRIIKGMFNSSIK
jgi:hypothetical protein